MTLLDEVMPSVGQMDDLKNQIVIANEKLELTSQTVSSHAFNLGCTVGSLPAAAIVLIVFLIAKGSLPSLMIAVFLVLSALVIFASLAAYLARSRTLQRVYDEQILPEIMNALHEMELSPAQLIRLAGELLPEGADLLKYLASLETPESTEALEPNRSS